ncbi:MAG: hypothetical protein RL017_378 [Pseudomonadota bacterium]|jgi:predicted TIM-barrel fold metal-dependent hydrolase
MNVIDAHIHFWDLNNKINSWVLNQPRAELHRNYLPWTKNNYQFVHIEAHDANISPVQEIEWLATEMNKINGSYKHIAFVDITQAPLRFAAIINKLKTFDQVVGIRHILAYQQQSQYNPCNRDLSSNRNIGNNLLYLANNELIFNCQIFPHQLINLLAPLKYSGVTTVIDHMFLPLWQDINDSNGILWTKALDLIANLPNVYLKLSGIDMFQPEAIFTNTMQQCLQRFPVARMLYGSNFPVSFTSDYDFWYNFIKQLIKLPEEQNQIFYANAFNLFFKT